MSGRIVAVRSPGEALTERTANESNSAPFTAVVAAGARLRPDFIPAVERTLADAEDDICLYPDFAVAGQEVAVGDWSVERARWQHWTGPVMVVPTRSLNEAQDPLIDPPRRSHQVRHLAEVLVDVDSDDLRDLTDAERARLFGHLPYALTGTAAEPSRTLPHQPTRSIVIPTRGSTGRLAGRKVRWLDECLTSMGPTLEDPAVDVVLVLDDDVDSTFTETWRERLRERLRILSVPGPFNFANKVNAGVAKSRGEVVVLLNDDVTALTPDWLDRLTAVAMEPDVGAVGPVLLYEDGTVQHRGHVFAAGEVHLIDRGGARNDPGPRQRNRCDRDVSGLTAACLVQRRDVWDLMGGLDPVFPVAFNDVDYCERLRKRGFRLVLCNSIGLNHFESRTRAGDATITEWDLIHSRWAQSFDERDPLTPLDSVPGPRPRRTVLRQLSRWWRQQGPTS